MPVREETGKLARSEGELTDGVFEALREGEFLRDGFHEFGGADDVLFDVQSKVRKSRTKRAR